MPNDADLLISRCNDLALAMIEGDERPYEVALRFNTVGVDGIQHGWEFGEPLFLMWAWMTDWVDAPVSHGGLDEPDAENKASAVMVRAAREWLVASADESAQRVYFDRWIRNLRSGHLITQGESP